MAVEAPAAMVIDDGAGLLSYSFALEYEGPPISRRHLPQAFPINVHKIPVAAVVPESCLSDNCHDYYNYKLSMPIVQPILASDFTTNFSKLGTTEPIIYPTSLNSLVNDENIHNDNNNGILSTIESQDSVFISSGEFSDVINSSIGSSLVSQDQVSAGGGSSRSLEFSDSFENSRNMSGYSHVNNCKESLDFSESNGSGLSFEYPSSPVSSSKDESFCDHRNPIVTFRDIESEVEDEGVGQTEAELKQEPKVKTRKGVCYRCKKGNRFTEKEVCIVCNAKYCTNCVLRAMGSMPEGRKCVSCIGFSIDESKRGNLGKCSRMLKRVLNSLEVRQIMKAEKLCAVNQLPSEYVCVNGKPLSHEELAVLQNCPNPPKKLKPGNYWYDKVSGLWGKEGEKPCKIISPHLNVGGPIMADASNGNTGVFINGREITKVELRMLQLSGVQCAGNPHFWVNEDGSYQEEGQKNTRGYIWGKGWVPMRGGYQPLDEKWMHITMKYTKMHRINSLLKHNSWEGMRLNVINGSDSLLMLLAGTKLVCAFLSLPVPPKSAYPNEQTSNMLNQTAPDYFDHDALQKILLIGCSGSGTSTIFKQAKILYKEIPFTEQERENIKLIIQSNVYGYLGILLEGRERFEDEALNERTTPSSDSSFSTGNSDANNEKTIYSICPRLKAFSDWLLKTMAAGNVEAVFPVASREYAPVVEELWNHPAVQATYKRRNKLETLPAISAYFLEQAINILSTDYIPSDVDILYADHVTSSNGLSCVDFSFPQLSSDDNNNDQCDSSLRFQLIRVPERGFGENCKWLEMFEDVQFVIFCVSLSDYDQYTTDADGNTLNKMLHSRKLFETIVTHPTYDQIDFLLVLNKFDIFDEKLERVPLTCCDWFDDFHPVVSRTGRNKNICSNNINHIPSIGQMASHYVAVKFKRLFSSLTDRKLFVSVVNSLEPDGVDGTLKYAKEILKWDEEKPNVSFGEYSIYSTEGSSHSP